MKNLIKNQLYQFIFAKSANFPTKPTKDAATAVVNKKASNYSKMPNKRNSTPSLIMLLSIPSNTEQLLLGVKVLIVFWIFSKIRAIQTKLKHFIPTQLSIVGSA